jgi:acetoin utilization deacetylase AcuC-like enzyme
MLKIAYSSIYQHPLPEGHRFPMLKYDLIPRQLLYQGHITAKNLFEPGYCAEEVLLLTHEKQYWDDLINCRLDASHIRRIGFPLSPTLVQREICIAQGTIDCALFAKQYGVSLNVAGGTHHAFTNKGEGFCLLNDFAIAANYLLNQGLAEQILIIDLDVHQGNGTAQIFASNPKVFTFSMHGKNNYPFFKEQSSMDVELPDGISGDSYLSLLSEHLDEVFSIFKPDFVFYLSGVDVLSTDKFGKLALSQEECMQRDLLVFEQCALRQLPVAVAMGGGYSPKIADIVNAHCNTFIAAQKVFFE